MANNIKPAANGLFVIILIFLKAELRINIFETDSQSPTLIFISFLAFLFSFFLIFVYLHRQVLNNQLLKTLQGGNAAKVIGRSGVI